MLDHVHKIMLDDADLAAGIIIGMFRKIRAMRVLYYATFSSTIYLSQNAVEARGVLPYMGYIGMCHCEGYGFEAVYSGIGYINQRVWV